MPRPTAQEAAYELIRTIEDYVYAAIQAEKNKEPDSMGAYYEEKALEEKLTEILGHVLPTDNSD